MDPSSWQSGALTVAAIVNVPIFIGALFLLQTKFRPELQEDSYYSTYLNNRTNEVMKVPKMEVIFDDIISKIRRLEVKLESPKEGSDRVSLSKLSYGVNIHLENQNDIEMKLNELGVRFVRNFGEDVHKPEKLLVAVSGSLPTEVFYEVLAMAKELGFEFYSFIEQFEEVEEDVLFGAYGDIGGRISIKPLAKSSK
ncbi:MAG: hypothetical protein R3222_02815 [Balneolaceae bacterium]|nr:hypothetical protein [Balneolaceae bacterium]